MKNPNLIKLEEVTKMKLAKIILRNDTAINWATVEDELILLKGEPRMANLELKMIQQTDLLAEQNALLTSLLLKLS